MRNYEAPLASRNVWHIFCFTLPTIYLPVTLLQGETDTCQVPYRLQLVNEGIVHSRQTLVCNHLVLL